MPKTTPSDFLLPAANGGWVDILVVAGEHFGDELAARMMASVLALRGDFKVCAVGGRLLAASGAQLLFDLIEHASIGVGEDLKPNDDYKSLVKEIVIWIQSYRPKMVVFVDCPKLNLEIAKGLADLGIANKAGGDVKLLYYVSPQVSHWKVDQKRKLAKVLDSLAVIYPFELDTTEGKKLNTRFVGHPYLSSEYDLPISYDPTGPILLSPGSSKSDIERIAPILFAAFSECLKRRSKLQAICVYPSEQLKQLIQGILQKYPDVASHIELSPNFDGLETRAVFTSSGTISLNCSLANIPGALVYRTHPAKYMMGRIKDKAPYIGIANTILGKPIHPELLQGNATPKRLAEEMIDCIENVDRIKQTRNWAATLRELLDTPDTGGPAEWLLDHW